MHSLGLGALFKDDDKGYKRPDDGSVSRAVGSCIGQNDQQLFGHAPKRLQFFASISFPNPGG